MNYSYYKFSDHFLPPIFPFFSTLFGRCLLFIVHLVYIVQLDELIIIMCQMPLRDLKMHFLYVVYGSAIAL